MKIKTILITMAATLAAATTWASPADSSAMKNRQAENLQIYHQAINYNDMATAASSLTAYLNAGGNAGYKDTLAIVYYNINNMAGSYKLATELYAIDSKNVAALTLLADISGRSGEHKTSLEWYEKLVVLKPEAYNFYQLATKQFVLERKLECRQSLQKVLSDSTAASKQAVNMEVQNGQYEQVPVLAAAWNMMGVLAYSDKKMDDALFCYQKALSVAPNFNIAKQNVEAMKQPSAPLKTAKPPMIKPKH